MQKILRVGTLPWHRHGGTNYCRRALSAAAGSNVNKIQNPDEFDKIMKVTDKNKVLYWTASWCPPCE